MVEILFKIFRLNPELDKEPKYDKYKVNVEKGDTVLDCLTKIKGKIDGSLTFRASCRSAICGGCAVKTNGIAKLICKTQVLNCTTNGCITLEPLNNMNIIKDLVVDFDPFWIKMNAIKPWVETIEFSEEEKQKEQVMKPEEVKALKKSEDCIMCGICYSDCEVSCQDDKFIGPASLVKAFKLINDPRDTIKHERLRIINEKGLWACAHSFKCVDLCPKNIDVPQLISDLRVESIKQGLAPGESKRHIDAFIDSLYKHGKLDEAMMPLQTKGITGFLGQIPTGIKLTLTGKVPSPFVKKIKNLEEVKSLCKMTGEKH